MVFLKLLQKLKKKEKQARILILGLDNAGKSTIVTRIMGDPIEDIAPTVGFQIKTLKYRSLTLDIWDIGGQKSLRPYWKNYFDKTDALIWVIDSADTDRLPNCRKELYELLEDPSVTLMILANKCDLSKAASADKVEKFLELHRIPNTVWKIQACSAITGEGVKDGFDWICDELARELALKYTGFA